VPEQAATALALAGAVLATEARRLGVEVAAVFDRGTGRPIAPYRVGRAQEVDVTDLLETLAAGRDYVAIHTHRESTAFSDADVDLLLRTPAVQTIAAVGWDGTWHLLSKAPRSALAAPETAVTALQQALLRLVGPYRTRALAAGVSREEAARDALHRIWRLLAPALGLRYDRSR